MGIPNPLLEFAELVAQMRAAQARHYHVSRCGGDEAEKREAFREAMNLEARVDGQLQRLRARSANLQLQTTSTEEPDVS